MSISNINSPELEFELAFEEIAGKDCPPVDTIFIKMIEDGDILLTDDLFFELVKESSAYLQTTPLKDKLSIWHLENNRKMLNRIQTALKPERRGRKATKTGGFKAFEILSAYMKNVKLINDFIKEHSGKPNSIKNELFRELYQTLNIDFRLHKTSRQLAYDLTSNELNISERTLRKITMNVHFSFLNQEVIKKPE